MLMRPVFLLTVQHSVSRDVATVGFGAGVWQAAVLHEESAFKRWSRRCFQIWHVWASHAPILGLASDTAVAGSLLRSMRSTSLGKASWCQLSFAAV